jgi:hypothetical protein
VQAYKEGRFEEELMDAIDRQNVAHDNVAKEDEFVVIDNGSSDEDAPLASTY